MIPFLVPFCSLTLGLAREDNTNIHISQATARSWVAFAFQTAGFVVKNSHLSINSATLVGTLCARTGLIFACGGYHSTWACANLAGGCMPGQGLLGYPTCP